MKKFLGRSRKRSDDEGNNVVLLPSSGVYEDRRNVKRWCAKLNERQRRVGGIIMSSVVEDKHSTRCLESITSNEVRGLPKDNEEMVHQVFDWSREEIMCAFEGHCDIIVVDEIGPEVVHGLGLDSALRACLWKAKEDFMDTLFVIIADPSLIDMFPTLYNLQDSQIVQLNTFRDFLKWGQSNKKFVVWKGLNRGLIVGSKSIESATSIDEEADQAFAAKVKEHPQYGTGPFYSMVRFPLLAVTLAVVFVELIFYVTVRQMVTLFENIFRQNKTLHKQISDATSYSSWRRLARQLDVIENKSGGSVTGHFPTISQFSESLYHLWSRLRADEENHSSKQDTNSEGSDGSVDISNPAFEFEPEHEILGCVRACISTLNELVIDEKLYSMNHVGNNVEMTHCLENLSLCLNQISKTTHPEVLQLRYWQEARKQVVNMSRVAENEVLEVAEDALNRIGEAQPMRKTLAALRQSSEIAQSRSLLARLDSFEEELKREQQLQRQQDVVPELSGVESYNSAEFTEAKSRFFSELGSTFGATALCLSGGAANAYYHLGVIRCLLDKDLLPEHLTGASGGALVGAYVATRTIAELKESLRPEVLCKVFDPCSDGTMGMAKHLFAHGTLFDLDVWQEKMRKQICGDLTFMEAYEKTGRSFTITVFNIDSKGRQHTRSLNYLSSPDVVIHSAVLASSALPKLLPPVELLKKDSKGKVYPYHSLGKFWRDGSFENELPFEALRQLFNVTFTIVSQVEPHISVFFFDNRGAAGQSIQHRSGHGWRGGFILSYFERLLKLDLRKWLELIRMFNLMPKVHGTDMSSVFLVRSRGNVTMVPPILMQSYTSLISDPNTPAKMRRYIQIGHQMAFPKLCIISDRLKVERMLRRLASMHTQQK